jgi:flagellar motor switch protein FliG
MKTQVNVVLGGYMSNEKSIVITVFGHDKEIDKFSVSLFDKADYNESNAQTYCNTINGLELKGSSWIHAKIVSENTQHAIDEFVPQKFDMILKFDDTSIQKILREVDSQEIAKALKGEPEEVKEKIFKNMSKRAAAMLKEDMEYMGPVPVNSVNEAQEKIIVIIRHLLDTGEIILTNRGETVE